MRKKIYLTDNGKAVLVTAPVSLFAMEVLARGGTIGFAIAAASTFVAARHGSDIKNAGARLLQGLIGTGEQRKPDMPTDEEVQTFAREYGIDLDVLEDDGHFDFDDETLSTTSPVFRFSELLASGFVPTMSKIFVGQMQDGEDIFVPASKLCHVAIAGKTGGGKGSLMRLIMTQLCFVGARVLLLNPHYMRMVRAEEGEEFDEDWSPFEGMNPRTGRPYLEAPPVACAEFGTIKEKLQWAVGTLLQKRKVAARQGDKQFAPYFIVIDEWPSIAKKIKDAPDMLAELLREGRKYRIFVIVASQDFQVKTIGMEGGSVRRCLLTCFYTGGDPTTAKELLYAEAPKSIPESELGQGTIIMRCTGTENKAVLALVPFVDNKAVYRLLGPSTFIAQRDEYEADELAEDMTASDEKSIDDLPETATTSPNIERRLKSADLHIDTLVLAWNAGIDTVAKIETFFKMSRHEAYKAYKRIKAQRGESAEEEEE
jgi:hypothetical protein